MILPPPLNFETEEAPTGQLQTSSLQHELDFARQELRSLKLKLFEAEEELTRSRSKVLDQLDQFDELRHGHDECVTLLLTEIAVLRSSLNDVQRQLNIVNRSKS